MDHSQVARELLQQLLASGTQRGALLKSLLVREFARRTGTDFGTAFWNYPKFSSFLLANSDLVDVLRPSGPGDVIVRLKQENWTPVPEMRQNGATNDVSFNLPKPLWHAFTNPDPKRRRFFHRLMHNVVHYVEGSTTDPNGRIAASVRGDRNYVEIVPVTAEQQNQWMKEFVRGAPIPADKKPVIDSLLNVPFTSQLNATFLTALGELREKWGQSRALHVRQHVEQWANQNGITLDDLSAQMTKAHKPSTPLPHLADGTAVSEVDLRHALHFAVDSMSSAELAQVLLPATALTRFAKGSTR